MYDNRSRKIIYYIVLLSNVLSIFQDRKKRKEKGDELKKREDRTQIFIIKMKRNICLNIRRGKKIKSTKKMKRVRYLPKLNKH